MGNFQINLTQYTTDKNNQNEKHESTDIESTDILGCF